ncbi:MAG TPA: hypothetical protein VML91_07300 [Burkholderiales bacterium]|nr:hypothetical protein [Burkholderiales bacterium]
MSPSWRDRVSIFFAPEHVHLARYARGWKPSPAIGHSIACGEPGATDWQPALEALQRGLANLGWQGADAAVTVSNHFVRYALVPVAGKLRGESERTAAAQHALRLTYGERADRWRVVLGHGGEGDAIAAGMEPELVDGIATTLAGAGLRPTAIEPFLAAAFNCCRQSIGREPAWLATAEPGRVCVAYLERGGWRRLRSERVRSRLEDELPAALERLRLADGIDAGPGRVLLVARDEQQLEFSQATGWTLERVRLEGAAAAPIAVER